MAQNVVYLGEWCTDIWQKYVFCFYWMEWVIVTQSCPTLWDPRDYSLPGSFVHGILQARILEGVAISFSKMRILLVDCTVWVFYIFAAFSGCSTSCWEEGVEALKYNCRSDYFSFQLFHFLFHVFWDSVVWYIKDCYVFLGGLSLSSFLSLVTLFALKSIFLKRFIYFWLYWVFIAVPGFSLVSMCGLFIAVASLIVEHGL